MAEGTHARVRTPAPTLLRGGDAPPAQAAARSGNRRRLVRWSLLILGPLLVILVSAYLILTGGRYVSIDDAYVKADMVTVSTDVSGMIKAVAVHNNETVRAGQVLFQLDDEPFRIALANAQAQLEQVRNDIEMLKASYRQKQEDLKTDQVNIDFYEHEFQRQTELVSKNVATRQQYDAARHNLDVARQQLAGDKQQLAGIAANLNGDPNIAPEKHPRSLQQQALRDQAARDVRRTTVTASLDGIVTNTDRLQPGQYLAAGTAAFSLVASDHVWIEANPKETELTYVKPGDPVSIAVDTYPGRVFTGAVASLSPASGSEFALLPAQNTSGNWVKVVQRIPIRLRVDTAPDMPVLRSGMSVTATIDTGHKRTLASVVKSIFG